MKTFLILFFSSVAFLAAQTMEERYAPLGELFIHHSAFAPFPHPMRANGRIYRDRTYSAEEHYRDSSVAIFIPKHFTPAKATDIVFYLHGHGNNIDKASAQFQLIEQFTDAKKNAVFVFPEGAKDAPDSFGGKLEDKDGLKNLLNDVLRFLKEKKKITSTAIGNIVLVGHSGSYRPMAFCLMRGGVTKNISDVILFDALYGQTEKFAYWIDHYKGRFINIYTDSGGTKEESELLMADLEGWGIPYLLNNEQDISTSDLLKNRIIFIHSDLTHSGVIMERKQFQKFLETSRLK